MAEAALNALPLATPEASRSRTTTACVHCGLPCRDTAVSTRGQHFCCTGCQTVYEILTENGLSHFYELSDRAGVTMPSSFVNVRTASATRMSAAPAVQAISSCVLPWTCDATAPRRLR